MKKHANTPTVARTVVLAFVLLNQVLTMSGHNPLPFSEDEMYSMLTAVSTVMASLWTWWKNNSFTQEAIAADEKLKELKQDKR